MATLRHRTLVKCREDIAFGKKREVAVIQGISPRLIWSVDRSYLIWRQVGSGRLFTTLTRLLLLTVKLIQRIVLLLISSCVHQHNAGHFPDIHSRSLRLCGTVLSVGLRVQH